MSVCCDIEQHATMFALLAKSVIEAKGDAGEKVIIDAVTQYGLERGKRMAERAKRNGDELSLENNQAYGEWAPKPGQMQTGVKETDPQLVTNATQCSWCKSWKKYNLLDYGKFYCCTIDNAVFQGFNPNFTMDAPQTMSWGAEECIFDWKQPLNAAAVQKKKAELGTSCTKDFDFHTKHLYYSIKAYLESTMGAEGTLLAERALTEFTEIFGQEYVDAFLSADLSVL